MLISHMDSKLTRAEGRVTNQQFIGDKQPFAATFTSIDNSVYFVDFVQFIWSCQSNVHVAGLDLGLDVIQRHADSAHRENTCLPLSELQV